MDYKDEIGKAYAKYEVLQGVRYRSQEEVFKAGANFALGLCQKEIAELKEEVIEANEHINGLGLLEKATGSLLVIAHTHGASASKEDCDKGLNYRNRIRALKEALEAAKELRGLF